MIEALPSSLRELMERVGPVWSTDITGHIQLMIDAYTALHANAPKQGVSVEPDIAYGPHAAHRMDIFHPRSGGTTKKPCVLFVHGGAFVAGNRNKTPEIYGNVLTYFARRGIIGVNLGYRLAAEAGYPGASLDIGMALKWLMKHRDLVGLDADRMYLMGHSAGGAHVGSYAYDVSLRAADECPIAGAIFVSGRVRIDARPDNPNAAKVQAYYGSDPDFLAGVSPVAKVGPKSVRTFVAVAEYENPLIDIYGAELAYKIAATKGAAQPFMRLRGHNHTSSIAHINTADEYLANEIYEFVRA